MVDEKQLLIAEKERVEAAQKVIKKREVVLQTTIDDLTLWVWSHESKSVML